MSRNSIFLLRARQELMKAWEWYEDRQPNLGARFQGEVYKQINLIEEHPKRYPKRRKNYRETKVAVFPYLIIYRLDERSDQVIIVSIFHTSRNPRLKYKK